MRKRLIRGKNADRDVMLSIALMYDRLKERCASRVSQQYSYMLDDIFHDTVIYIAHDKLATGMKTDKELMLHFIYRFRMIAFQTIKDIQQLKEINYADNKQTKEEEE
jgi:hypothetical protein